MTGDLNGVKMNPTMPAPRYHHGDLRPTLLREAAAMLNEQGLEGLTLRKLAERSGVTAAALYHHFEDKNDLLSALAQEGFVALEAATNAANQAHGRTERERVRRFVRAYVGFARQHPETYDLMFGRTLWKAGRPTDELREVAYATFRRYLEQVLPRDDASKRALRIAQVSWATLHGFCRLLIDGIYIHEEDIDAMCDEVVESLVGARQRLTRAAGR